MTRTRKWLDGSYRASIRRDRLRGHFIGRSEAKSAAPVVAWLCPIIFWWNDRTPPRARQFWMRGKLSARLAMGLLFKLLIGWLVLKFVGGLVFD